MQQLLETEIMILCWTGMLIPETILLLCDVCRPGLLSQSESTAVYIQTCFLVAYLSLYIPVSLCGFTS